MYNEMINVILGLTMESNIQATPLFDWDSLLSGKPANAEEVVVPN
jgi:hypothetical protein